MSEGVKLLFSSVKHHTSKLSFFVPTPSDKRVWYASGNTIMAGKINVVEERPARYHKSGD
jgi:hypothetical protein